MLLLLDRYITATLEMLFRLDRYITKLDKLVQYSLC